MSGPEDERDQAQRFRADLAEELRGLIQSLEENGVLASEVGGEAPAGATPGAATDLSELANRIDELHASIEEADAELILAVRLLRSFVRASVTELSDQLLETEHGLRDEIRRVETQLRNDIAALRSELESQRRSSPRDDPGG